MWRKGENMEIYKNLSLEDLPNEEWRDVVGYEGLYQVSNLGRVKSLSRGTNKNQHTNNTRIMKQHIASSGYLSLCFEVDTKKEFLSIHRLVANAFLPNPNNLPCVNHKDENKLNNKVDNLEFCTYKYNSNYGTIKERKLKTQRENSKYSTRVFQYDLGGQLLKEWNSIYDIFDTMSKRRLIYECCIRKRGSGYGYQWRFCDDCDDIKPYKIVAHNRRVVLCFNKNMIFLREYDSVTDAAKALAVSESNIVLCCKGTQKTVKGFIFRYK